MTPRENIIRALRRQGFEWVPLDLWFCDSQINDFQKRFGNRNYKSFFDLDHRWVKVLEHPGYDIANPKLLKQYFLSEDLPGSTVIDEWGIGHSKGSEAAYHMTRMHHPLKGVISTDLVAQYPMPIFNQDENQAMVKAVSELHANGLAVICDLQMTIWEVSWYLRSMEELIMDMMMEDEKAGILLDKVTDYQCQKARFYAMSGADILSLGDDIGTQTAQMISLDMWERWLKPRLIRVINAAKEVNPEMLIFYHSCGHYTPFIPGLLDAGVNILNPIQPESMDFNQVHELYGDKASFWGTLGAQELLPFGSIEEVQEEAIKRIKTCGEKGGLVLGPAHLVEPEVPFENLLAFKDAARKLYPKKK